MKNIILIALLTVTLASACSHPEEPKATTTPSPSSSVGSQYGNTLKGGIDKAKEIQNHMGSRIQQLDEAAKQPQPSADE